MKKNYLIFLALAAFTFFSCEEKELEKQEATNVIPEHVVKKLQTAGFDTSEGLRKFKDGYLVEYDIYLTEDQIEDLLNQKPVKSTDKKNGKVSGIQHYSTSNLVTGMPRTLSVYMDPSFGQYMQSSFNVALNRYNDLTYSSLKFRRVSSTAEADIVVNAYYEVSNTLGVSAGFPSGGNPAKNIYLNTYHYNESSKRKDAATTIAHEIGHAVGFRHTDYMNRKFSCGAGGNEGDAGVGAAHIPGTPTNPATGSWMLACSNNTNRPFTRTDAIAIATLYPNNSPVVPKDHLNAGERLYHGQQIKSSDGRYRLIMQGDGNLVIYNSDHPVWHSNTWEKPQITYCVMQGDGNLVLYDNNGKPYWDSGTWRYPGGVLVMQSDGNLVIYQNGVARWASNTWNVN